MEILQTIWNALTTENYKLALIICSPLTLIEVYLSALIFLTILNIKTNKKKTFVYVLFFSLIAWLTVFVIPTPFNTFINIIACPILVYFIFKTNILKAILAEIIPYIIFFILSSLLITFFVKITGLPSDYFLKVPLYKASFSLFNYSIIYIFYLVCNKYNINISLLDKMKKQINSIIFINFIIRNHCNSTTILYLYNLYKQITYSYNDFKFNCIVFVFSN